MAKRAAQGDRVPSYALLAIAMLLLGGSTLSLSHGEMPRALPSIALLLFSAFFAIRAVRAHRSAE